MLFRGNRRDAVPCDARTGISANIAAGRHRFRRAFGRSFAIDHFKNEAIHEDEARARKYGERGIIDRLALVRRSLRDDVDAMPPVVIGPLSRTATIEDRD
jgi:hypothetical protein